MAAGISREARMRYARRRYWSLAMAQPLPWLQACAADPSPHMKAGHVAILRAVIRRKLNGGAA